MSRTEAPPPPTVVTTEGTRAEDTAAPPPQRTFASRLDAVRTSGLARVPARPTGAGIIRAAISEARTQLLGQEDAQQLSASLFAASAAQDAAVEGHTQALQAELYKDNPMGLPPPGEESRLLTLLNAGDPFSSSMRLLRLQYLMHRMQEREMFASNKLKSDRDGNKDILDNVR